MDGVYDGKDSHDYYGIVYHGRELDGWLFNSVPNVDTLSEVTCFALDKLCWQSYSDGLRRVEALIAVQVDIPLFETIVSTNFHASISANLSFLGILQYDVITRPYDAQSAILPKFS